jgi:hypothetical protein
LSAVFADRAGDTQAEAEDFLSAYHGVLDRPV